MRGTVEELYPRVIEAEQRELARIGALRAEFFTDPEFVDEAIDWGWSVDVARERFEQRESGAADRNVFQHGVRRSRAGRAAGSVPALTA